MPRMQGTYQMDMDRLLNRLREPPRQLAHQVLVPNWDWFWHVRAEAVAPLQLIGNVAQQQDEIES